MRRLTRMLRQRNDEDGQGLVVVLLISMLLMALVVSTTTIAATNIVPARQSADSAAALAAAQGGIQDFIADVNTECKTPGSCGWITTNPSTSEPDLGAAKISWTILNPGSYTTDGFVRIRSVGTINPGKPNQVARTLVADIQGSPNLLDYLYYTKYEAQSAALVNAQYPNRTIPITKPSAGAGYDPKVPLSPGDNVSWAGAGTDTDYPTTQLCDQHWYDSASGDPGRYTLRKAKGISDPSNAGIDWGETGTVNSAPVDRTGACEVSFSTGSQMNGKVYSEDALLVSSGTTNGAGPVFRDTVETGWTSANTPSADLGRLYRTFPQLPNSAPALGSKIPQRATSVLSLPSWDSGSAAAASTCEYTGPTRIRIVGDDAFVTSPLTPASSTDDCYKSTAPAGVTAPLVGGVPSVLEAKVEYKGQTIYVKDAAGTQRSVVAPQTAATPRDASNSVFLATGSATGPAPTTSIVLSAPDAAWDSTGLAATATCVLLILGCNTQGDRLAAETGHSFAQIQDAVQAALAAAPANSTAQQFSGIVQAAVDAQLLTPGGGNLYRYVTTVGAPSVPVQGPSVPGASNPTSTGLTDPLYTSLPGAVSSSSISSTSSVSVTVTRECKTEPTTVLGIPTGGTQCVSAAKPSAPWGLSTPQFSFTATRTAATTSSTVTPAISAFPLASDRTSYSATAGDAYVEGSVTGAVSIAAEDSVVVTGNLTQADGIPTAGSATEVPTFTSPEDEAIVLASKKNVFVYHPVSCLATAGASAIAATTAGFCPDDVTGLYSGGMTSAAFATSHPSQQYVSLLPAPVSRIDAAIFAIGGSFALQNPDKAGELGTLSVNGGVYQQNRGVTGVEWEVLTNTATRPHSGYTLEYRHDDGLSTKALPWVPSGLAGTTGRIWNLQGYSEQYAGSG